MPELFKSKFPFKKSKFPSQEIPHRLGTTNVHGPTLNDAAICWKMLIYPMLYIILLW